MERDLLGSVTELTHRLRREQATLALALTQASQRRDGTDESGTMTILIDDAGTARDVIVAADWRRRLPPEQVGGAVVAADTDAARRRAVATAEALAEVRGSTTDAEEATVRPDPSTGLGPVSLSGGVGRPLSVMELTSAVLAAVEDLERATTPPPAVHGGGAGGAVRVTLDQGRITECLVNQRWLAQQDEVTLAHALREAISAAAAAGLAARAPFIEYQQRLDAIVVDARATLQEFSQGPRP